MRKDELKQLYESIMLDVAKVVKRRILEYGNDDNTSTLTKVMQWLMSRWLISMQLLACKRMQGISNS